MNKKTNIRGKEATATERARQLELFSGTAEESERRRARDDANARMVPDRSGTVRSKAPKPEETTRRARPAMEMEAIAAHMNLRIAFEKVAANKGAPGPDGKTIEEVAEHLSTLIPGVSKALLDGSYTPGEIRRVWIPKADGGKRGLGIPNVVDRMVQQAILHVLEPHYDETFHDSSHGFRPRRSCHTAIEEAKEYLEAGAGWVVDIDLEKFFDKVNHQRLISRLEQRIKDVRVINLIRKLLRAKVLMPEGIVVATEEGTPQGGPLSPLLSNIVLDELDRELQRRGLWFVRYADDCNIYVRSERAGRRVMESIRSFIEKKLKLKVNEKKSTVSQPANRHFLGFSLRLNDIGGAEVGLSQRTRERSWTKLAELIPRNWGSSVDACIERLNQYLRGWIGFFRIVTEGVGNPFRRIEAHARRRLRAVMLKHWKRRRTMVEKMVSLGVSKRMAVATVYGGKRSIWKLSHTLAVEKALSNAWFEKKGLISITNIWRRDLALRLLRAPVQLELRLG